MKKAILLVRVSTVYQEYKDQTAELKEFVKRDGYKDSEMEIIEDKESATKLSDEERQGLSKMWDAINNPKNKIECVYCWELSRLSRKPKTLFDIKEKLISRGINLRTKIEGVNLITNGIEDYNANIPFAVFSAIIESEGQIRKARTSRSKRAKAVNQGYNGGWIKYGYYSDSETKTYQKDPEKEEIIKLLFELYSTGKYGYVKLYQELLSRGKNVNIRMIGKILNSKEYTGETVSEYQYHKKIKGKDVLMNRYTRSYPAIISPELFEKCKKVAVQNNTHLDKSKNVYYANKLIKCSACGSCLVAMKYNAVYLCMHKYSKMSKKGCSGNDSININVIDSILWGVSSQIEVDFIYNFNEKQLEEWQSQITELQTKIDNSENYYDSVLGNEIAKLRKVISVENMNDKDLKNLAVKQTKADRQRIEQERINYQMEIKRLKNLIIEAQTKYDKSLRIPDYEKAFVPKIENIVMEVNNSTEKQRYDIIHKHIKKVSVSKVPDIKATKKIEIECYNGKTETYYYAFRLKDKSKQIYQIIDVDSDYSFVEYYSFEERYIKGSKIKRMVK